MENKLQPNGILHLEIIFEKKIELAKEWQVRVMIIFSQIKINLDQRGPLLNPEELFSAGVRVFSLHLQCAQLACLLFSCQGVFQTHLAPILQETTANIYTFMHMKKKHIHHFRKQNKTQNKINSNTN